MIVAQKFLKSIPKEEKLKVLQKLKDFESEIRKSTGKIREISSGYWIRRVMSTEVFKFRLNNKDRVLFSFVSGDGSREDNILFLEYVKHDDQIRKARGIKLDSSRKSMYDINFSDYVEVENTDTGIEEAVSRDFGKGQVNIGDIPAIQVEDEYLKVLAEENNEDYLYYLSDEQYEPLKCINKPVIVSGAGGTGKTLVLLNKVMWAEKSKLKAVYITYTDLLVEDTRKLYEKFAVNGEDNFKPDFYSIRKLYETMIDLKDRKVVSQYEFIKWIDSNKSRYRLTRNMDSYDILTEIKGIIKGYLGLEYRNVADIKKGSSKMLSLDDYLGIPLKYSGFSDDEKKALYKLTLDYQGWIEEFSALDENDLARDAIVRADENEIPKYDLVVVDEVQDLSEAQIYMLTRLVDNPSDIMWGGDFHQIINPIFFNFGRLKNLYYSYGEDAVQFGLAKNYRSTKEIVGLINKLSEFRKKTIGKTAYEVEEQALRNGKKPVMLNPTDENLVELLRSISDKHYCAVIVPDEEEKQKLVLKHREAESRIFTVYEVKGLEYENIYCYNIVSKYAEHWDKIMSGSISKDEKMRYYFNLLYVAVSRAKEFLCICEENENAASLDFFSGNECADVFELGKFRMLKSSTKEDWQKESDRLEKMGQHDKVKLVRNLAKEENIYKLNRLFSEKADENMDEEGELDLQKKLEKGRSLCKKRKYNAALSYFNEILESCPDNSEIYYRLGNTYCYMLGGVPYSIQYFEKAISLDPDRYEVYLDLVAVLKSLERYGECMKYLNEAIRLHPRLGNAYFMRGLVYEEMKDALNAKKDYERALELHCYIYDSYEQSWDKHASEEKQKNELKSNIKSNIDSIRTSEDRVSSSLGTRSMIDLAEKLALIASEANSSRSTKGKGCFTGIKTTNKTSAIDLLESLEIQFDELIDESCRLTNCGVDKNGEAKKTDYSLIIYDRSSNTIEGCVKGKKPELAQYSKKKRVFRVKFDKDFCQECDKYENCPMGKSDKNFTARISKRSLE